MGVNPKFIDGFSFEVFGLIFVVAYLFILAAGFI